MSERPGYDRPTDDEGTEVDDAGRDDRPERVLGGVLLVGAVWFASGVVVWLFWLLAGRVGWLPWLPLSLLALAVPYAQGRAALLLLRPPPAGDPRARARTGTALGLLAGLGVALFPLPLTGRFLGTLQPGLATLPVLLTVAAAGVGVLLLVTRHGLAVDRLAGPPVALVLSATATALVWAGLALDAASLLLLVPALPAVGVVLLSALRGPAGYRTGLLLGWWWGLVATGGSLLVFGVYLAVVYGQAWAGLVIVGVAVALVAAWWALRKAPAGS